MHLVTIDFETYWDNDYTLSKMGPIEYIRDPRFRPQLLGVQIDNNEPVVLDNERDMRSFLCNSGFGGDNAIIVGHNFNGFDGLILSEYFGVTPRYTFDTMAAMRWTGLSRCIAESHATLTGYLGNGIKTAGTVISKGKHWPHDFSAAEQQAFINYCRDDVRQCAANMYAMLPYCTLDCVEFSTIITKMATEPVFELDTALLEQYIQELDRAAEEARAALMKIFPYPSREAFLKAIRSNRQFGDMLRHLGVDPPMKISAAKTATAKAKLEQEKMVLEMKLSNPGVYNRRELLERKGKLAAINAVLADELRYQVYTEAFSKQDLEFTALLDHEDQRVVQLVSTRLEHNSSIQRSRAERFLSLSRSGKPLPVMLNVWKAHTSRLTAGNSEGSSDGTNLQNLNKRNASLLTLRRAIKAPDRCSIVSVDSSQIEARLLAYLAGQLDLLDVFARGGDPYSELAEAIFSVGWKTIQEGAKNGDKKLKGYRTVGKTGILSAGYGVGAKKFSETLLRSGVKLHNDTEQHHQMAHHAWNVYRMRNQNIVQFWTRCQQVLEHMLAEGSGEFGGPMNDLFSYGMMPLMGPESQKVPTILMPTGFSLRYFNLRGTPGPRGRMEMFYDRPRGRNMVETRIYGGSLCENLTQGLAFQLLQWQALGMAREGVRLVCNVHDAWLGLSFTSDANRTASVMRSWMTSVPSWLFGLPVACTVEVGNDYTVA